MTVIDVRSEEEIGVDVAAVQDRKLAFLPRISDWTKLTTRQKLARVGVAAFIMTFALLGYRPYSDWGPTFALNIGMIYAIVTLAVSVLGWIREISLAVVAQMGLGLIVLDYLQERHWPMGLIIVGVIVSSIPVSVLLGLFALRLRGVNFVIASLAFGYMVQRSALAEYLGAGASEKGTVSRPSYIFSDEQFYYWLLGSLVVCAAICYLIQRSNIGKALAAMRDSETAFWTLGHSPALYKMFAVCLSGAFATLGGMYFAMLLQQVPALYYTPGLAIVFFGYALAGGMGSIGGAIASGLLFGAVPKYLEAYTEGDFTKYDFFFMGFLSLLIFMKVNDGLGGLGRRIFRRIEGEPA
jgi:branched-chain amino acid transport system permease protein